MWAKLYEKPNYNKNIEMCKAEKQKTGDLKTGVLH
jgi:hypothetical protein